MKKIGIDFMAGDNPTYMLGAILNYVNDTQNEVFVFTTHDNQLNKELEGKERITLVKCESVVDMHDEPAFVVRKKKDSTLVKGSEYLRDGEIEAFISAGNTGALVAAGVFVVKRLKGVSKPSLPGLFPKPKGDTPLLILDLGANIETTVENMVEQAKLANTYMKVIYGIENPEISLLNIGAEATKGTDLYKKTYEQLMISDLNFKGNIEGRDLLVADTDVVICDGWTGNVVLKSLEGAVSFFKDSLKQIFMRNVMSKLSALIVKKDIKAMSSDLDYKELGATPVLGVNGLLLKCHGSSDERAYYNALAKAEVLIEMDMVKKLEESLV